MKTLLFLVVGIFAISFVPRSASADDPELTASQVTVVADSDHTGDSARNSAIGVLQSFSSARRCVFVEVPPNFNSPMQSFMFQRSGYAETVGAAIARYQSAIGYNFQNVVPSYFLSSVASLTAHAYGVDFSEGSAMETRVRNVWRSIAPYLNRLESAPKPVLLQFVKMLDARSAIMAANVSRMMHSGACQEAVFVVGEAHLRSEVLGIPMRSIQADLARKGISARY